VLGPLLFSLYLLPLGSILRKHGIAFYCYADDCQIYVPLKMKDSHSIKPLLNCLEDIKGRVGKNGETSSSALEFETTQPKKIFRLPYRAPPPTHTNAYMTNEGTR